MHFVNQAIDSMARRVGKKPDWRYQVETRRLSARMKVEPASDFPTLVQSHRKQLSIQAPGHPSESDALLEPLNTIWVRDPALATMLCMMYQNINLRNAMPLRSHVSHGEWPAQGVNGPLSVHPLFRTSSVR